MRIDRLSNFRVLEEKDVPVRRNADFTRRWVLAEVDVTYGFWPFAPTETAVRIATDDSEGTSVWYFVDTGERVPYDKMEQLQRSDRIKRIFGL